MYNNKYTTRVKRKYAKSLRRHQTPGEKKLWWLKLIGYKPQVVTPSGYIADYYNKHAQMIVEVDGSIHRFKRGSDRNRDRHHRTKGIYTVRVKDAAARKHPGLLGVKIAYLTFIWYLYRTLIVW